MSSVEFKLVDLSIAHPGNLKQNADEAMNDTTADDDLNRAWAALFQEQRSRLRQSPTQEWIKQRDALPKDDQNEFAKANELSPFLGRVRLKSNSSIHNHCDPKYGRPANTPQERRPRGIRVEMKTAQWTKTDPKDNTGHAAGSRLKKTIPGGNSLVRPTRLHALCAAFWVRKMRHGSL